MTRKTLTLTQAQAFHNAAMQSPYMSSKHIMYRRAQRRLMATTTPRNAVRTHAVPPATIKAIVDAIATKRNVTLYKDN